MSHTKHWWAVRIEELEREIEELRARIEAEAAVEVEVWSS